MNTGRAAVERNPYTSFRTTRIRANPETGVTSIPHFIGVAELSNAARTYSPNFSGDRVNASEMPLQRGSAEQVLPPCVAALPMR